MFEGIVLIRTVSSPAHYEYLTTTAVEYWMLAWCISVVFERYGVSY